MVVAYVPVCGSMVQLPRNYVAVLRVRAECREKDARESKMGTYSVPGYVDSGDYHYIYMMVGLG